MEQEIHACSQSSPSLQEHSQMEKKMVFGNIDWKLVKQELPGNLSDDKTQELSKIVGMSSYSFQELAGHSKTELIVPQDTTLIAHQEVSLIATENGYPVSQHQLFSPMTDSVSSMIEINTEQCLTNGNCQIRHVDTSVKHTQILGTYLDSTLGYTSYSQRKPAVGTAHISDACEVNISVDKSLYKTTDAGTKLYNCDDGSTSFTQADQLKYHMGTHTGEKPSKCDVCAASFTKPNKLKHHMRTQKSLVQASNLNCLITHTEEKPYKCDDCGASLTVVGSLKHHMRTHTGEKPYKCDNCGLAFAHSGNLKRHMRTHTGVKPYRCDVCVVAFFQASNLKRHMRIHTGKKPYRCDDCGASFTGIGFLKYHMRTHRGE